MSLLQRCGKRLFPLALLTLFASCASGPAVDTATAVESPEASDESADDANAAIAAGVPSTDIVMVSLPDILRKQAPELATNVAVRPGYDNQPMWAPDGRSLMFASIVDGRQSDVFRYVLKDKRVYQVTDTPQSEYSPTPLASEQWTCIRVDDDGAQRLGLYGLDGQFQSYVREDVTGVGYHRWLAHDKLAVFIVDDPVRLELIAPRGDARTVVAQSIGRSLNRTTYGNLAFVAPDDAGQARLYEYDVRTGETIAHAAMPVASQDIAWLIDDTALVADGRMLYRWQRELDEWVPWVSLARVVNGDITRMAVDPAGQWLALVVGESG